MEKCPTSPHPSPFRIHICNLRIQIQPSIQPWIIQDHTLPLRIKKVGLVGLKVKTPHRRPPREGTFGKVPHLPHPPPPKRNTPDDDANCRAPTRILMYIRHKLKKLNGPPPVYWVVEQRYQSVIVSINMTSHRCGFCHQLYNLMEMADDDSGYCVKCRKVVDLSAICPRCDDRIEFEDRIPTARECLNCLNDIGESWDGLDEKKSFCPCAGCDKNVEKPSIGRCRCGMKCCCAAPQECSCVCHKVKHAQK